MKLSRTEKILGIILLVLWIVLFTAVIESVAEGPNKKWVASRLLRDYGWVGNIKRDSLLREYRTLGNIAGRIKTELRTAIESKDAERTKALIATCKRLEIAIRDFLDRSETFIKTHKGI